MTEPTILVGYFDHQFSLAVTCCRSWLFLPLHENYLSIFLQGIWMILDLSCLFGKLDDLGYICRICGVIEKSIKQIYDFQWEKGTKTTRNSNMSQIHTIGQLTVDGFLFTIADASDQDFGQMKAHQIEGFNFLLRNFACDSPGDCIWQPPGLISRCQTTCGVAQRNLGYLEDGNLNNSLYDLYTSKAGRILFLGYKQFASIVSNSTSSTAALACHYILLKVPTILILDEGHTPRNETTDVLYSLSRVQTPRKKHVKHFINILNLVRSKVLKVMSRVQIAVRKQIKSSVTNTMCFITKKVILWMHLTVLLTLNPKQKHARSSMGSAVYSHPLLKKYSCATGEKELINKTKIDELFNNVDITDGVKAEKFLTMLALCGSAGEFSRLEAWSLGKKIFVISGDSSQEQREISMERLTKDAKIFIDSIKACGDGISLVGASRLVILDIYLHPSVTDRQLVVHSDLVKQKKYMPIVNSWFEWNEICGYHEFAMQEVNTKDLDDSCEPASMQQQFYVLYYCGVLGCCYKLSRVLLTSLWKRSLSFP
ncbi:hypothetical protein MKW94_012262 [Papaver nudicaule]|uniref:SNF2 N-terminal domain-containing protein n=1 Tax=Papaver nudicaule TaxID=74823 RepID=A0AA41SJS5_PAPNU|nr:hypothetical protein [Papaver nudicaule]